MPEKILIVDDDPAQRKLLQDSVRQFGFSTVCCASGEAVLQHLSQPGTDPIAVMILDLVMPDLDGMGVLEAMRRQHIRVPVIVQTAHGSIDTIVSAIRAGASDFIVKPVSTERLRVCIDNVRRVALLEDEVKRIKRVTSGTLTFSDLTSQSEAMERVIRLGQRAAGSSIPILLEGESGVGKEVVARAIQGQSERRARAFVTVNCGAIPENLVESILFGHEKGAFTGASNKRVGKFQEAHKGTLFLDEIGELPAHMQVKLLRAVQQGEIEPVGARRPVKVNIRLISATNKSLLEQVKKGEFREDLYYRLNVFPIFVPPLRERREDVTKLAHRFAVRFAAEEGKNIAGLSSQANALLTNYHWPGNVRQLENAVFRAVVLADGNQLGVDHFPQIMAQSNPSMRRHNENGSPTTEDSTNSEKVPASHLGDLASHQPFAPVAGDTGVSSRTTAREPHAYGETCLIDSYGQIRTAKDVEEEVIRFAIAHYNGRMSEVARRLKIGRSTLYRKLKRYGIATDAPENGEKDRHLY